MLKLTFFQLILWQLIALTTPISGVNLKVRTRNGPVVGVLQSTFVNKVPYISYKGIPYAQPPIGPLRFKATRHVKSWTKPIVTTNEYKSGCIAVSTALFQLNTTRSQDCLYLNVYTPVLSSAKTKSKLPVIFYIDGGGFVEGDGSDWYQGPDFMLEENVILVTINYRFGFANFEAKGYTGNMDLLTNEKLCDGLERTSSISAVIKNLYRYSFWITAESVNVTFNPFECFSLVFQAHVAGGYTIFRIEISKTK